MEIASSIDNLYKKTKQHDGDILTLSENVYDYSFKEMAASFDERMDNRLSNVKTQIIELTQQVQNAIKNPGSSCVQSSVRKNEKHDK